MATKTHEFTVQVVNNHDTGSVKLGEITQYLRKDDVLVINGREVRVSSTNLTSTDRNRWCTYCGGQRYSFPVGNFTVIVKMTREEKEEATDKKVA